MKTIDTHGSFEDTITGTSTQVQELAHRVRRLIADVYADVVEVPWPHQRIVGYGVGPKKMSEHFCYVAAHAKYVNLGFNHTGPISRIPASCWKEVARNSGT